MPGTVKKEPRICGSGQDCIGRTAKRDLKIPLIIILSQQAKSNVFRNQQINSKADFSGKEAGGFMGLVVCGEMPVSMSKSPLLSEASWWSWSFPLLSRPDGTVQCHAEVLALIKKQDSCTDS